MKGCLTITVGHRLRTACGQQGRSSSRGIRQEENQIPHPSPCPSPEHYLQVEKGGETHSGGGQTRLWTCLPLPGAREENPKGWGWEGGGRGRQAWSRRAANVEEAVQVVGGASG